MVGVELGLEHGRLLGLHGREHALRLGVREGQRAGGPARAQRTRMCSMIQPASPPIFPLFSILIDLSSFFFRGML